MRVFVEVTVKKWRPWMRKFNMIFSRADRKIEIVIFDELFPRGMDYENDSNRH